MPATVGAGDLTPAWTVIPIRCDRRAHYSAGGDAPNDGGRPPTITSPTPTRATITPTAAPTPAAAMPAAAMPAAPAASPPDLVDLSGSDRRRQRPARKGEG